MFRRRRVSEVKRRVIHNVISLIDEIGRNDFKIKYPNSDFYIVEMTPTNNNDVSITVDKSNKTSSSYLYTVLSSDSISISYILYIIEELKFLIQYENAIYESREWDSKKRKWVHGQIDEVLLSNKIRNKISKR